MEKNLSFKAYDDWRYIFDELSDEKAGVLIKIIFDYTEGVETNITDETLRVAFAPIKKDLDREREKREHISRVRSEAGRKGGLLSGQTRKVQAKAKEKATRFKPPTLEEVKEYCVEKKNSVDAEKFISYYSSVDWKIGKSNKKMKDWQAAVDYWERENQKKRKPDKTPATNQGEFKETFRSRV